MIFDERGALYGTTGFGGTADNGVVFKINTTDRTLIPIWRFSGSDGANPFAGLIADESGALYGTANPDRAAPSGKR